MWRDSPAVVAVEVVRVVGVVLKDQRLLFDDGVTLLADILAQAAGFLTVMARPTQVPGVRRGVEPTAEVRMVRHDLEHPLTETRHPLAQVG